MTSGENSIGRGWALRVFAFALLAAVVLAGWSASPARPVSFTAISGTVNDAATHLGIPGVHVCLESVAEDVRYCEDTGLNGQWGLQVAERKYRVEFNGQSLGYVPQFYDHQLYREVSNVVTVGSEEITGIDAELVIGGEIRGEVTEAAGGAPVAFAEACAHEVDTKYRFGCGETDASGHYSIKGLPEDKFDIQFQPRSEDLADQFYDHADYPWDAEPVAVHPGESVSGIDAALRVGATIEGTVRRLDGGIADDYVRICAWSGPGYRACTPAVFEGTYRLSGLRPGEYNVEFFSYFDELKTQFWNHVPTQAEAEPLQLGMGMTAAGIDADMEAKVVSPKAPSAPPVLAAPSFPQGVPVWPRPIRCRKGLHKRRVAGKVRCVRKHKHHRGRR